MLLFKKLLNSIFALSFSMVFCSYVNASQNIIHGEDANNSDFNYLVELNFSDNGSREKHYCDGILISPSWVLTTANCVSTDDEKKPLYNLIAYIGRQSFSPDKYLHKSEIKEIYIHPRWFSSSITTLKNRIPSGNIALIELKSPADNIQPVLYDNGSYQIALNENDPVTIAGFGLTQDVNIPNKLQKKIIKILPNSYCINTPNNKLKTYFIPAFSICAGHYTGGIDLGDAGGPLVATNNNNESVVVGIASGMLIPPANTFTRVTAYAEWINETINKTN